MSTLVEREETRLTPSRLRMAVLVLALALLSAPLLAQRHASPRSGGGGGSSSGGHAPSGGGGSHGGPSGSHSSGSSAHRYGGGGGHSGGGGGGYYGDSGGSYHRPPGYSHDGGHHHGGYYPYYGYSSYYYPYYGFGFGFGYYSPYYYGYYGYPYYGGYYGGGYYRGGYYGGGYYGRSYYPAYAYPAEGAYAYPAEAEGSAYGREALGAVALKVKPKTAEVYIDGRYVGATGSYDGYPGYLWLPPGTYRLELVQEGFANLTHEIQVSPGQVIEFKQPLEPGVAVRPEPSDDRGYDRAPSRESRAPYEDDVYTDEGRRAYPPRAEDQGRGDDQSQPGSQTRGAKLVLDVQPDDASVYLDGRFIGTGRQVSTATEPLPVAPGEHRVQIVHPSFTTEERTINVKAGEERLVEVALRQSNGI